MFKKIALAASLALAATSAHARTDFSTIDSVTKAKYRASLHVYNQNCGSWDLGQMLHELETYETVDMSTYYKTISELEAKKDTLCNDLVPEMQKLETVYRTLPIAGVHAWAEKAPVAAPQKVVSAEKASGAMNNLVHNVTANRGETCQRIDENIALCSLFKHPDYKSLFVAMPEYNRNVLKTSAGRLAANAKAEKECAIVAEQNYFVTRGYRTEVYAANVLADGDVVIINCAYQRFEKK